MRPPLRIATVYKRGPWHRFAPTKMSTIRWWRMSEALADRGYRVDMIMDERPPESWLRPNLRVVTFADVEWDRYDAIKTLFHSGFDALWETGGGSHPFIISKLGSVVGSHDQTGGVYFFMGERERLYATQQRIRRASRYVTLLTAPSKRLWEDHCGTTGNVLLVPTGVDREIPAPRVNPYRRFREPIAVYIGNIYAEMQKEMNEVWQGRLNDLGARLSRRGIRLCFVGTGRVHRIDPRAVTVLGPVHNRRIWDYHSFADVGVVLAQGAEQHNESSKLYYYLRAGLPVVSEAPVPNNALLSTTGMGTIADYGDHGMLADMIEAALHRKWPRGAAVRHMIENHTWDQRAATYDELLGEELASGAA